MSRTGTCKLSDSNLTDNELMNAIYGFLSSGRVMTARDMAAEFKRMGKDIPTRRIANSITIKPFVTSKHTRINSDYQKYRIVKAYVKRSIAGYTLAPGCT
jgi:hypothetical protein